MELPFGYRLAALGVVALVMIVYDRRRQQGAGQRGWEYGLLLVAGLVGAIFGAVHDAVTVWLSPAYFELGKGLGDANDLGMRAVLLGAKAGCAAAVVGCAIWQFAWRRIPVKQRCLQIARRFWIPFVCALLLAVSFPIAFARFDPLDLRIAFEGLMTDQELSRLLMVWWIHMGSYCGLIAGIVVGIIWKGSEREK